MVRFFACVGMYPSDVQAAVDELLDALEDAQKVNDADGVAQPEKADRLAAVSEGGAIHALLSKIDAFIAAEGGSGTFVGPPSLADVHVFSYCSNLASGFFDGVPHGSGLVQEYSRGAQDRVGYS